MKKHFSKNAQWLAGLVLVIVTLCWCFAAGRILYYAGDYMVGAHPVLLLLLPFGYCIFMAMITAGIYRKWRFATLAMVSLLAVVVLFSQLHHIGMVAWTRSIHQNDATNQSAIARQGNLTELTADTLFPGLYSDDELQILDGFKWYCEHHHASRGGKFRAFVYGGHVHIRIQKIRHGYRGIVFLPSPTDRQKLVTNSPLVYENTPLIDGHWLVWSTQ